jgi:transcriptional regulator with GAF, ATPase, and Fis domain
MMAFAWDHRLYSEPDNVVPVCRVCNIKRGPAEDVRDLVRAARGLDKYELIDWPSGKHKTLKDGILEMEKAAVMCALERAGFNMAKAARQSGVTYRAMRCKVKKHKINPIDLRNGKGR